MNRYRISIPSTKLNYKTVLDYDPQKLKDRARRARLSEPLSIFLDAYEPIKKEEEINEPAGKPAKAQKTPVIAALLGLNGEIAVFSLDTWEKRLTIKPPSQSLCAIAISSERSEIYAASCMDNAIYCCSALTGEAVMEFEAGGNPSYLAVDEASGLLLSANSGTCEVWAYRLGGSKEPVAKAPAGINPLSVSIDAARRAALVANSHSDTISVFDLESLLEIDTIKANSCPISIATNNATSKSYISCFHKKALSVYEKGSPLWDIPLGSETVQVCCDQGRSIIYAAGTGNTVYAIDGFSDKIVGMAKTDYSMHSIACEQSSGNVYIADHTNGCIKAYSQRGLEPIGQIPLNALATQLITATVSEVL
ncbi:MAG: beta-propeller fold lactonase family protein [Eubacteriaceae bacterium]|nr:beta-propeller fold lactonase family protein [Eubacteriaceae bacterium]